MKTKTWFQLSLMLNFVLAVGLFMAARRERPAGRVPVTSVSVAAPNASRIDLRHDASLESSAKTQSWLQQLRMAGVPDSVLARTVIADFEAGWDQRRRELQRQLAAGDLDPLALAQFEAQHDQAEETELRAALGDEGFRKWDQQNILRDFAAAQINLSPAESDAVYDLKKKLARDERELANSRLSGDLDDGDFNDRRMELEKAYDDQLKTSLGDQRYATLQGGGSDAEATMRRNLKAVNANDTQITAVLEAERQWTDRRAEFERGLKDHPLTPEEYDVQAHALDVARDQDYQRLLGADGFAQFQKSQDSRYQLMKRYAGTWNLTDADVDHLYSILLTYEKDTTTYKSSAQRVQQQGQDVDWPGVQQNLQIYSQQTEEAFRAYLGDDRFSKLTKNNVLELGR